MAAPASPLSQISLALNGILAIAVAFLFYKVYSPTQPLQNVPVGATRTLNQNPSDTSALLPNLSTSDTGLAPFDANKANLKVPSGIVFVNTDTLLANYTVFKKQKATLEARTSRLEQDIASRVQRLETELGAAQQKMQAGQLTQPQAEALQQEFAAKQASLGQYREEQAGKLMEEEKRLSTKLNETITGFMKKYATPRGYRFVFGYTQGGGILYAQDSLDITQDVIRGMNGIK
jgi:outer membrane protein